MNVRVERTSDMQGIRQVNLDAFETSVEADLVDALRERGAFMISLVAVEREQIVGHIMFSEVEIRSGNQIHTELGLAPMAVRKDYQGKGVGSNLITAGLEACRKAGYRGVIVLGHPKYYPRFGFKPASNYGFKFPMDVPDEAFMALELVENGLSGVSGEVTFRPEIMAAD